MFLEDCSPEAHQLGTLLSGVILQNRRWSSHSGPHPMPVCQQIHLIQDKFPPVLGRVQKQFIMQHCQWDAILLYRYIYYQMVHWTVQCSLINLNSTLPVLWILLSVGGGLWERAVGRAVQYCVAKPCLLSKSELTDVVDEHWDFRAIFTSLIRFGSSNNKNKTK